MKNEFEVEQLSFRSVSVCVWERGEKAEKAGGANAERFLKGLN